MRYVVILFIIAIFIFLGVLIFGHHSSKPPITVNAKSLPDYANTDVEVRYTVDGQINGDEDHRQIIITVGRDQRILQVNKGYQGSVLKKESFNNNSDAYSSFLNALSLYGFTLNRLSKFSNEQGQCPLSQRYVYEVINNGNKNLRTWSTSCNSNGTFKGQASTIRSIFQNQIGNYSDFTSDVVL